MSEKEKVFVDYDDTLFPTTYLDDNGILIDHSPRPGSTFFETMNRLDLQVVKFLEEIQEHGELIILTNAEEGWVTQSCEIFMPESYKIISVCKILSARDLYAHKFEDPGMWKKMLLVEHLEKELRNSRYIISIGDSEFEREAAFYYARKSKGKTGVKNFLINADVSSIHSTTSVLNFLTKTIKQVIDTDGGMDKIIGQIEQAAFVNSPRKSQIGPLTPKRK
jgi:hypothetical protein